MIQTSAAKTLQKVKRRVEKLRHREKNLASLQGTQMKPSVQCGDGDKKANKSSGRLKCRQKTVKLF